MGKSNSLQRYLCLEMEELLSEFYDLKLRYIYFSFRLIFSKVQKRSILKIQFNLMILRLPNS